MMFWKQLSAGFAVVLLAVVRCSHVGCGLSAGEEEVVRSATVGVVSCVGQSVKKY